MAQNEKRWGYFLTFDKHFWLIIGSDKKNATTQIYLSTVWKKLKRTFSNKTKNAENTVYKRMTSQYVTKVFCKC